MSIARPRSVPAGARKAVKRAARKTHKDRPSIGRGNYVKAPLLRDKATKPRWMANAVVNNPGNLLAAGGIGAGTGVALQGRQKVRKADDRKKQAAAGAAAGAGGAHFARVGGEYAAKATAERQFKPLTTKGNYGPYTESPHKPALNKYKRTVHGSVREKARQFDANFPKGIPSYRARKTLMLLDKKPVAAGIVGAGAAAGAVAGHRSKVHKSAFGVDHG